MVNNDAILLDDIIQKKRFHHVIQPIYDLRTWKVLGYEALLRSETYQKPELLFNNAIKNNRLYEIDTCSIYYAITSVGMIHERLFVNIYPSTMLNPSFSNFIEKLKRIQLSNLNVVFEINETEKVTDIRALREVVNYIKIEGYSIAMDDFNKGKPSMKIGMELELNYVKLSPIFSKGLYHSIVKQNYIEILLRICQEKNMKLILEGIENARDLAIAKILGVHFGQGYILGEPKPINEVLLKIK